MNRKPLLVLALGGNALIRKGQRGTLEEQLGNLKGPMRQVAALAERYRIIITHGNGPQVGNLLLQQEATPEVPPMPLEVLVAQTEGQIGYMIESTLDAELMDRGVEYRPMVSCITYVVVDPDDPAFLTPSKPIGPVLSGERASSPGHPVVTTAKGVRRAVASPEPLTIVERREIRRLADQDFIVICCGGGGIPVVREGRGFHGVEAVIDKDLVTAQLAIEVEADALCIATDEEGVMLRYGTPDQELLRSVTVAQAKEYQREGHFPEGSMGPKVRAATRYVLMTGNRAAIGPLDRLEETAEGACGTQVVSE